MVSFQQSVRSLWRSMRAHASTAWDTTPHWRGSTAEARSTQLLVHNLSATQRAEYAADGYFEVTGGDTGTRYRIQHGYQLNIEELDQAGRRIRLLCFLPGGRVPIGDIMLAQKIALELFEFDALRVAHRTPVCEDWLRPDARIRWIHPRY